jgi:hypothetical protein
MKKTLGFTDLTDKNALLLVCLVHCLKAITPEVASSSRTVLLPVLQAHPTEVKFALRRCQKNIRTLTTTGRCDSLHEYYL